MWRGSRAWLVGGVLLLLLLTPTSTTTQAAPDDTPSEAGVGGDAEGVEGGNSHHRARRQLLDGFRPSVDGILAMERLDEMLRSTIPDVDRFNCVERLMCSLAAGQQALPQPEAPRPGQFPAFDPTFQQGLILNPSTIQQSFSGLIQNPAALQQGLQGLVQSQGLQGFVQNSGLQQGLQQTFPSFQSPGFQTQPIQGASPFLGGNALQRPFPSFRGNPDATARAAGSENKPPSLPNPPARVRQDLPLRRQPLARRRPQRRNFFNFFGRLGRRKKRDVFDDLLSGLTPLRFMGLLDQMMTRYSFYPYTHAAYMGLSGSSTQCETLYPKCPSTPEDMLDLFNNIHKYYPDGIPYKENLPWPLNILLP